jgi:hypothetical protein
VREGGASKTKTMTEMCILCGHVLIREAGRRYKKHEAMADLITQRCTPTAFVYSIVMKYRGGSGKHTVCIACVNWTRRLSLRAANAKRIFIPMDNVIMFAMKPGQYLEPDKRTLVRLLRSISVPVVDDDGEERPNHYTSFESGTLRSVKKVLFAQYFAHEGAESATEYCKDSLIDTIVREWWIFNGMPTFLQDKTTGRYVRRMLRAHKIHSLRI